ncbi:MAG: hypothetical protein AB7I50_23015 [Vicinamibacterales bacterium]
MTITLVAVAVAVSTSVFAWRIARESRERSAARVAALASDLVTDDETRVESSEDEQASQHGGTGLFVESIGDESGRLAVPVIAGVLAGIIGLGTIAAWRSAASEAVPGTHTLELVALRHVAQGEGLDISGLVRNPSGNDPARNVVAVVFAFDKQNNFITSARAPLDFATLAAGDESPFVVTLGSAAGVARYRVSFRRAEGSLLPHVDRREVAFR